MEVVAAGVADDDVWAPIERPDEIAMAEVDKAKSKKLSKVDKVWPRLSRSSQPPTAAGRQVMGPNCRRDDGQLESVKRLSTRDNESTPSVLIGASIISFSESAIVPYDLTNSFISES